MVNIRLGTPNFSDSGTAKIHPGGSRGPEEFWYIPLETAHWRMVIVRDFAPRYGIGFCRELGQVGNRFGLTTLRWLCAESFPFYWSLCATWFRRDVIWLSCWQCWHTYNLWHFVAGSAVCVLSPNCHRQQLSIISFPYFFILDLCHSETMTVCGHTNHVCCFSTIIHGILQMWESISCMEFLSTIVHFHFFVCETACEYCEYRNSELKCNNGYREHRLPFIKSRLVELLL